MKNITINIIPQLKDNYSYIIESKANYSAVIIDPAEASLHCNFMQNKNLNLDSIILTHHHHDHTSGVRNLIKKYPSAKVYSPNTSIDETTNLIQNNDLKIGLFLGKYNFSLKAKNGLINISHDMDLNGFRDKRLCENHIPYINHIAF